MIITGGKPTQDGKYTLDSSVLVLRWREEDDKGNWIRREEIVRDFKPYGFVNSHNVYERNGGLPEYLPRAYRNLKVYEVEDAVKRTGGATLIKKTDAVDLQGNPLWKVEFDSPTQMRWFKRKYNHDVVPHGYERRHDINGLFEMDVPYGDRYLLDKKSTLPAYKPRLLFFDLESTQFTREESPRYPHLDKDGHDYRGHQEINTIGCYDNYSEKYVQWFQHPEITPVTTTEEFEGHTVEVRKFDDEKDMLQDWVEWLDMIDPDMLLAWASGFYDLPTLYTRLEATGVGADKLSPSSIGSERFMHPVNTYERQYGKYGDKEQCIVGRIVVDLKELFGRVYMDTTSQPLPSKSLDNVGMQVFGRGKTDWKPDFWAKDYIKDEWKFLFYNWRDVELMVALENQFNVIDLHMQMQQLCGCSFVSTQYATGFGRIYLMRKAPFKQICDTNAWIKRGTDYDGALVLDPEERGGVGLLKNVAIIDYAGLYPAMTVSKNIDYTTIVEEEE